MNINKTKLKHNESGFSHIETFIFLIVVVLIGVVGFYVYKNGLASKSGAVASTTISNPNDLLLTINQDSTSSTPGNYITYHTTDDPNVSWSPLKFVVPANYEFGKNRTSIYQFKQNQCFSPSTATPITSTVLKSGATKDIYTINKVVPAGQTWYLCLNDVKYSQINNLLAIAYSSKNIYAPEAHIVAMNSVGKKQVSILDTTSLYDISSMTWSPDGTKLAFKANNGAGYSIYVINKDGDGLMKLPTAIPNTFISSSATDIMEKVNPNSPPNVLNKNNLSINKDPTGAQLALSDTDPWSPDSKYLVYRDLNKTQTIDSRVTTLTDNVINTDPSVINTDKSYAYPVYHDLSSVCVKNVYGSYSPGPGSYGYIEKASNNSPGPIWVGDYPQAISWGTYATYSTFLRYEVSNNFEEEGFPQSDIYSNKTIWPGYGYDLAQQKFCSSTGTDNTIIGQGATNMKLYPDHKSAIVQFALPNNTYSNYVYDLPHAHFFVFLGTNLWSDMNGFSVSGSNPNDPGSF